MDEIKGMFDLIFIKVERKKKVMYDFNKLNINILYSFVLFVLLLNLFYMMFKYKIKF